MSQFSVLPNVFLGGIHAKRQRDEDARRLKVIQDLIFEDGDLDADGGEGKLEVAAPNQEGGVTQAQETTCRMAIVVCSVE